MRLLLLRHAQTEANVTGALDTAAPGWPLTALGRQQAAAAARELSQRDAVVGLYASPLQRAHDTAAHMSQACNLPISTLDGLREISAGRLEMADDEESRRQYLETVFAWSRGNLKRAMTGGESGLEFVGRFDRAIAAMEARSGADGLVVAVTHGAALRSWAALRVRGVDLEVAERHRFANTAHVEISGSSTADGIFSTGTPCRSGVHTLTHSRPKTQPASPRRDREPHLVLRAGGTGRTRHRCRSPAIVPDRHPCKRAACCPPSCSRSARSTACSRSAGSWWPPPRPPASCSRRALSSRASPAGSSTTSPSCSPTTTACSGGGCSTPCCSPGWVRRSRCSSPPPRATRWRSTASGRETVFKLILAGVLIPQIALAIPQYLLLAKLGMTGTYWSVLLPSLISPFSIYLCRVFAESAVPDEILEAARVDGAGELRLFWSIGLRLMLPGLVTVFLLQFVAIWNNFMLPYIMLSKESMFPLTVGLFSLLNRGAGQAALYTLVITGALVSIVPLVALFVALQRYWRLDVLSGGLKG